MPQLNEFSWTMNIFFFFSLVMFIFCNMFFKNFITFQKSVHFKIKFSFSL